MRLTVNGQSLEFDADPDMPLLWRCTTLPACSLPARVCGIGKRVRMLSLNRQVPFA